MSFKNDFEKIIYITSILSIIILILCFIMHWRLHFITNICCFKFNCLKSKLKIIKSLSLSHRISSYNLRSKAKLSRMDSSFQMEIMKKTTLIDMKCCAIKLPIIPRDKAFGFFPIAFIFYIIYIIFLCGIIISKYINNNNNNKLKCMSPFILNNNNNKMNRITNIFENMKMNNNDYVIIYGLLILSLWETLFFYHRYYSTKYCAKYLGFVSLKRVLYKFSYKYFIWFVGLYIMQMYYYYYLFPLLLVFNTLFNIYCTKRFVMTLKKQYKCLTEHIMSNALSEVQKEMISTLNLMRNYSYISILFSCTYMFIFTFCYSTNITICLPILWSLSLIAWSMNFTRNRQFWYTTYKLASLKCISCIHISNDIQGVPPRVKLVNRDTPTKTLDTPPPKAHIQQTSQTVDIVKITSSGSLLNTPIVNPTTLNVNDVKFDDDGMTYLQYMTTPMEFNKTNDMNIIKPGIIIETEDNNNIMENNDVELQAKNIPFKQPTKHSSVTVTTQHNPQYNLKKFIDIGKNHQSAPTTIDNNINIVVHTREYSLDDEGSPTINTETNTDTQQIGVPNGMKKAQSLPPNEPECIKKMPKFIKHSQGGSSLPEAKNNDIIINLGTDNDHDTNHLSPKMYNGDDSPKMDIDLSEYQYNIPTNRRDTTQTEIHNSDYIMHLPLARNSTGATNNTIFTRTTITKSTRSMSAYLKTPTPNSKLSPASGMFSNSMHVLKNIIQRKRYHKSPRSKSMRSNNERDMSVPLTTDDSREIDEITHMNLLINTGLANDSDSNNNNNKIKRNSGDIFKKAKIVNRTQSKSARIDKTESFKFPKIKYSNSNGSPNRVETNGIGLDSNKSLQVAKPKLQPIKSSEYLIDEDSLSAPDADMIYNDTEYDNYAVNDNSQRKASLVSAPSSNKTTPTQHKEFRYDNKARGKLKNRFRSSSTSPTPIETPLLTPVMTPFDDDNETKEEYNFEQILNLPKEVEQVVTSVDTPQTKPPQPQTNKFPKMGHHARSNSSINMHMITQIHKRLTKPTLTPIQSNPTPYDSDSDFGSKTNLNGSFKSFVPQYTGPTNNKFALKPQSTKINPTNRYNIYTFRY